MSAETFMNIAKSLFLVGTLLLSRKVLKNKNMLKDFDLNGSILTCLGTLSMIVALALLNAWVSVVIAIPTILFWGVVSMYSFKR